MCVRRVCSIWPAVHKDDVLSFCFTYVCVACIVQDGWTSLFIACENGHDKVAGLLLQNGADVNAATKVSKKKKGGCLEWERIRQRK